MVIGRTRIGVSVMTSSCEWVAIPATGHYRKRRKGHGPTESVDLCIGAPGSGSALQRARKENVVLQVDVLVHVLLERRQTPVERPPGGARLCGRLVPVSQLTHPAQRV